MKSKPESSQVAVLLQETIATGEQASLTVTSNSMSPLIRRGDQVVITRLARPLQPGDIITFLTGDGLLTHRFWGYWPDVIPPAVCTRGDKPQLFDPPTPADQVLGQVIMRQRHGRWLDLQQGRGYRLNQHLIWLAHLDNQVITRDEIVVSTHFRPAWWRQGIHWVLHLWARVVTAVVL